ncbi:MAG: hypothetical protein J6S21_04680 [Victivallales bacterium]|jgi:hypothetical protein|nr:hypothetical protein [Victivallales bacterium]
MLNVQLDLELFELGEKDSPYFRVSNKAATGAKAPALPKKPAASCKRTSSLPPAPEAKPAAKCCRKSAKCAQTKKAAPARKVIASRDPYNNPNNGPSGPMFGGGPSGPMFGGGPSGPMFGGGGPSGPMYGR